MLSFPESKTWDPWGPHQITQTTLTSYSHIFCSIVLDGQNYIAMAGIHIYTNLSLYVYISRNPKNHISYPWSPYWKIYTSHYTPCVATVLLAWLWVV